MLLALAIGTLLQTPSVAPQACDTVPGMSAALEVARGKRFIVMGEVHGSEQPPALFANLICSVAQNSPVNVLLEFRTDAAPALDAYMASDGSQAARAAFLAHPLWSPRYADGRNSKAMFDLVEKLRRWKQSGLRVRVYCTQPTTATLDPQFYGELGRAGDWARLAAAHPDGVNLILVGNAHAALFDNNNLGFPPAAAHLRREDVLALGPVAEGGATWSMHLTPEGRPEMGPHAIEGRPARRGITLLPDVKAGWDGTYAFGEAARPSQPKVSQLPLSSGSR